MGKILIIKGADFSANSFDKDNIGQEENFNDRINWIGILGGQNADFFVEANIIGEPIGTSFLYTMGGISYERSVGILDVSEYVGRQLSMTFGQNRNSQNPDGMFCAFISGSYSDPNSLLIEKFNNWIGGPVIKLNTIIVTVPIGARYLCFSHAQESTSPFNGNIILLSEK